MISLHCKKCYEKLFTFSSDQYNSNITEYEILKSETINLKILARSLVICEMCSEIIGQTTNGEVLFITKRNVYTCFGEA